MGVCLESGSGDPNVNLVSCMNLVSGAWKTLGGKSERAATWERAGAGVNATCPRLCALSGTVFRVGTRQAGPLLHQVQSLAHSTVVQWRLRFLAEWASPPQRCRSLRPRCRGALSCDDPTGAPTEWMQGGCSGKPLSRYPSPEGSGEKL